MLVDYPSHPEVGANHLPFGRILPTHSARTERHCRPALQIKANWEDRAYVHRTGARCEWANYCHCGLLGGSASRRGVRWLPQTEVRKNRLPVRLRYVARELVLHPDDQREMTYVKAGKNRVLESALQGFEGAGETVISVGVPMLLAVRRIPHTDWIVAVQVPQKEAVRAYCRIACTILLYIECCDAGGHPHRRYGHSSRFEAASAARTGRLSNQHRFGRCRDERGVQAFAVCARWSQTHSFPR